jgi:hypothetical protein
MAAYGRSLVVDPGRYTYDESGDSNWRVKFRETAAHNTVVVDGKNQTQYIPGKGKFKIKGPEPARALQAWVTAPGFDFVFGAARSHEYPVLHERKIFFVCPDYWIVSDRLTAQEDHTYDVLFHLSQQAQDRVALSRDGEATFVRSPHLLLAQLSPADLQVFIDQGYVSPTYGVKHPAPVIRFRRQASSVCFHTILSPSQSESGNMALTAIPVYAGERLCDDHEASCLRITHGVHGRRFEDTYFVSHALSNDEYHVEGVTFQGKVLFRRRDERGQLIRQHVIQEYSGSGPSLSGNG